MAVAVTVVCLIGAASWFLLQHPEWFERRPAAPAVTSRYSDTLTSYIFYEPDYSRDVTKVEEYMELDRYIHIQRGAENFAVTDGDCASWGEDIEFFGRYFAAAIAGDAETYNSLFTEAYYRTNEPYERFAPQMIYGITLEKQSETDSSYVYDVTYAIYRNDGTLRNDVGSDAFRTLIFTLKRENGALRIDSVDFYRVG
jgi:hypothetical protein